MTKRSSLREAPIHAIPALTDAQLAAQPAVRSSVPESHDAIARVEGSRAGVVEWANEAFESLSGIALSEIVGKPITRFLDRIGLELEVVDFVAQHFLEGRTCRIELPYQHPGGRRIEALLEVDPLFDDGGEIDRFTAIVREQPRVEPLPAETTMAAAGTAAPPNAVAAPAAKSLNGRRRSAAARTSDTAPSAGVELGERVRAVLGDALAVRPCPALAVVDVELTRSPVIAAGSGEAIDVLIRCLIEAACAAVEDGGNAGSVITIATEIADPSRLYTSKIHPTAAHLAVEIDPPLEATITPRKVAVLEVHDTGDTSTPPCDHARARIVDAAARAGARVVFDSTPGCGNQTLVVFALA